MIKYAANTSVSSNKSRDEIERTLTKYGANSFMYAWEGNSAVIGFRMQHKMVRLMLRMPHLSDREFITTPTGRQRSASTAVLAHQQAIRQRWRSLSLVVKAKLEAVESGITTFEEEFLAHILLPDNTTAGDYLLPQIEKVYETGEMPAMLPMLEGHQEP